MFTYKYYVDKIKIINSKREAPPLCHVHSFGCQQNVSDGEKITGILADMGYGVTGDLKSADIIIYNTCAVRENAELKVFGCVGELKHLKEEKPDLIIALCGCMMQQEHIAEKVKKTYKQVDIVFGTFSLDEFPKLLFEAINERKKGYDIRERYVAQWEEYNTIRNSNFKANVTIMNGCNNFCSYCIVPYVRGRERSRSSSAIINEIKQLAEAGYKEIMLLGQNVNSYGRGLDENIDFNQLLRKINRIDGDFKIRFMSSHPKDVTNELINTIIDCDKVCKHLHFPLQSGSNKILLAMNRHYTIEQYVKIVDYARSKIPDFSFSTDIIVGFPNETEEDFLQTKEIIQQIKYDNIYSYIYSKREGTKAAELEDSIVSDEKSRRIMELIATQRNISTENYKRFIGRELSVLFDSESKTDGYISGKSDEFIIVESKCNNSIIGQRKTVKITESFNWALHGEIID